MADKIVDVQADPDPTPLAGQRPGPPFFAVLIVAGVIVICAGLQSAASIVAPVAIPSSTSTTVCPGMSRSAGRLSSARTRAR